MKIGEKPMRTSVKLVLGDSFFNFHFVDTGFLLQDGENKHVMRKPVHCVALWVVRGRRIQPVDNLFDVELNLCIRECGFVGRTPPLKQGSWCLLLSCYSRSASVPWKAAGTTVHELIAIWVSFSSTSLAMWCF